MLKIKIDIKSVFVLVLILSILMSAFLYSYPLYAVDTFMAEKYNFTQRELLGIASMCMHENSGSGGVRAEASLMANLYESKCKNKGETPTEAGFIKYITTRRMVFNS